MSSNVLLTKILCLLKRHYPQGIALMDITKEYRNMFGRNLNPIDHDFKSLYDMMEAMAKQSDHSLLVVNHNTNNYKKDRVFLNEDAYDKWIDGFKRMGDIKYLEEVMAPTLPEDVPLQHLIELPSHVLPEEAFKVDQISSLRVTVIHVESPNRFSIRLRENDLVSHQLNKMLRFYDGKQELAEEYDFPKELIVVGYYCAVRNPKDWDNWHRGVIIEFSRDFVTVYAIDFGNTIDVKRKDLRLLKESLLMYPPLAVNVSLCGIAPSVYIQDGLIWSDDAINYFKSLVKTNKYRTECVFLYPLRNEFWSVLLFSSQGLLLEEGIRKFPIYFHEKLIENEWALMIPKDFNQLIEGFPQNFVQRGVSEAIEEPLLAIKYEPEFDAYESPAIRREDNIQREIKIERIAEQPNPQPNVMPNGGHNRVADKPLWTGSQNNEPINYKQLFFTEDKSPQMVANKFFPKSEAFPFIEHKYYSESKGIGDNPFVCYERKYFNEEMDKKSMASIKMKYFDKQTKEKTYPSFERRYYREPKSYPFPTDDTPIPPKYYNCEENPFVEQKFFPSEEPPFDEHKFVTSNKLRLPKRKYFPYCEPSFEEHKYFPSGDDPSVLYKYYKNESSNGI